MGIGGGGWGGGVFVAGRGKLTALEEEKNPC